MLCPLENVAELVYLGMKIDSRGSFKGSLKFLSEKASKACFALNKTTKLKKIPINIVLKLSDILATFERFDFVTWDTSLVEMVHAHFCIKTCPWSK